MTRSRRRDRRMIEERKVRCKKNEEEVDMRCGMTICRVRDEEEKGGEKSVKNLRQRSTPKKEGRGRQNKEAGKRRKVKLKVKERKR